MALSQDLINQFVKLTNKKEKPKEVIVNGTYKTINGEEFVQIDGSEIWTPVTSTVEAETGERVKVMIKNHTAIVTGNISSPSARSKSVQDLKDEVDENGNTIKQLDNTIIQQKNSITQINNNINQVNNTINQHNNVINQQGNIITQLGNEINQQGNVIKQINNDIEQQGNNITQINNTVVQQNNTITQHGNTIEQQGNIITQQGNEINQHGNKIDQLDNDINQQGNAITQINNKIVQQDNVIQQQGNIIDQQDNIITEHGNNIMILNSGFSIIDGVLVGLSQAIIDELKTQHLDAEYATIDFANINMAAVTKLFTESGIIKDLVVQEGKITGELVGVTLKGDLIEGNTIRADKLVVKGEDGVYYKLNIDGLDNISTSEASKFTLLTEEPDNWKTNYKDYYIIYNNKYVHISGEESPTFQTNTYYKLNSTYESGLDGTVIVAHSVTADKIAVTDLVAFGATIGGFNISQHSIYSGGKNNVNNTSRGIYMDDSGQIAFGDNNNFIKFFKDIDNQYKIMIRANEMYMGTSTKTVAEQIEDAYDKAQEATDKLATKDIIIGTQTESTRFWTGVSQLESLHDGDEIIYWLPYASKSETASDDKATSVDIRVNDTTTKAAGTKINTWENSSSNVWLNLTLKDGTSKTGWIPCYYGSTSRLTTHYAAGNCIRLIYRVNANIAGIQYTGFFGDANYNTNDYDRIRFNNAIKAKTAISASRFIVSDSNGFFHLSAGVVFDIDKPILWANADIAANATGSDNYLAKQSCTVRNNTSSSWTDTQYKTLYLVGILNGNQFTVDSTTPFTTTVPITDDGKYYISFGYMYSTYQVYLYPEHPIFKYVNGQFKNISQIAYEAQENLDNLEIGGRNLVEKTNQGKKYWNFNVGSKFNPQTLEETYWLNTNALKVTSHGIQDASSTKNWIVLQYNDFNLQNKLEGNSEYILSLDTSYQLSTNNNDLRICRSNGTKNIINSSTLVYKIEERVDEDNNTYYHHTILFKTYNTFEECVENDRRIYITGHPFIETENTVEKYANLKLEKGNRVTDWTPAPEDIQTDIDDIRSTYLKETTFTSFKRDQIEKDNNIIQSLKQTSVTIYGNDDGTIDPDAGEALVNRLNKVDNDLNGEDGALDRIEAAEGTLENTGLNEYDQAIKITQRFLNIETDVEQIKNIFKITGGTNLIQNSVGYFADKTGKPTMWDITANTIYTPFGYDGDLVGVTISRGKLFCAKGSMTTTQNNIMALLANKKMSISFKYKNGANATSKVKIFNGSVTFFEKTFSSTVNSWTEVTATFDCTVNSLQITIESTNTTNNNGILISDLMLNYGDVKPWELCSNEVYGAMVKLSSLGIEVTATKANTKNFMTTDGILVYEYDSQHDIVGNLITKITDDGILTNQLESTGDIIERNLVHTMIKDSANHNVYVEYIR